MVCESVTHLSAAVNGWEGVERYAEALGGLRVPLAGLQVHETGAGGVCHVSHVRGPCAEEKGKCLSAL